MIPGEVIPADGDIQLNTGAQAVTLLRKLLFPLPRVRLNFRPRIGRDPHQLAVLIFPVQKRVGALIVRPCQYLGAEGIEVGSHVIEDLAQDLFLCFDHLVGAQVVVAPTGGLKEAEVREIP